MIVKASAEGENGAPPTPIPTSAGARSGVKGVTGRGAARTQQAPVLSRPHRVQPDVCSIRDQRTPPGRGRCRVIRPHRAAIPSNTAFQALEPSRRPSRDVRGRTPTGHKPWDAACTPCNPRPLLTRPSAAAPCTLPEIPGRNQAMLVGLVSVDHRAARPSARGDNKLAPGLRSRGRPTTQSASECRVTACSSPTRGERPNFPVKMVRPGGWVGHRLARGNAHLTPGLRGGAGGCRARPDPFPDSQTSALRALKLELLHGSQVTLQGPERVEASSTHRYELRRRPVQLRCGPGHAVNKVIAQPISGGNPATQRGVVGKVCGHPPRKDRSSCHPEPEVGVFTVEKAFRATSKEVGNTVGNILAVRDDDTTATRGSCLSRPKRRAQFRTSHSLPANAFAYLELPLTVNDPRHGPSGSAKGRIAAAYGTAVRPADGERPLARGKVSRGPTLGSPRVDLCTRWRPAGQHGGLTQERAQASGGPATQG